LLIAAFCGIALFGDMSP